MTEAEQVKEKLENLKAVVLLTKQDYVYVLFNQKGKTKFAAFGLKGYYYDRYGPSVLATFNGSRFWFKSGDVADWLTDADLEEMKKMFNGESKLKAFDPTILGDLKS
jgi:hypothetical protein